MERGPCEEDGESCSLVMRRLQRYCRVIARDSKRKPRMGMSGDYSSLVVYSPNVVLEEENLISSDAPRTTNPSLVSPVVFHSTITPAAGHPYQLVRVPKAASSAASEIARRLGGCTPRGPCCRFPGSPRGSCPAKDLMCPTVRP